MPVLNVRVVLALQEAGLSLVTCPHWAVQMDLLSLLGSVTPQDSASQAGQVLPLEGQLAAMFAHGSLLQSMPSDMIASWVNSCLDNLAKLPASSLSKAECLASSRPTSPKPAAPSRVQEALLAEGAQGCSLGQDPLSVRLDKHAAMVDALSFRKRFWAKVGGSVRSASLSLPSARDPNVAISEVLGPLTHLTPSGLRRTACGDTEHQTHPAT
ncbi:hypothetical protein E2C01_058419 [Portunus trituberculatus]|uniref:Uncharacterized protein n=1 Tax=Portunus trituberculatus TaxID=210409 RepID=A0A5B7H4N0_PORTR|nr:hypothetical protein [Portunus trituberculatus]